MKISIFSKKVQITGISHTPLEWAKLRKKIVVLSPPPLK